MKTMSVRCSLPEFLRLSLCLLLFAGWPCRSPAQTSSALAEVRIRGDVRRILPMPDGSFILGGYTAYYNGVRETQLLRVMPNGARVAFPVAVNGAVFALAADGPWVYLGGDFQTVNGSSVPFAARVNATTGAVDATWRPAPNGDLIDIIPVAGRSCSMAPFPA